MPLYINLVERTTEYVVKSTYRYLFKRKRVYKFETLVLNFIRKQGLNKNFYKDYRDSLKDLKRETGKLLKDPFEKKYCNISTFLRGWKARLKKGRLPAPPEKRRIPERTAAKSQSHTLR